jgi:tetratricopeptide (TPR) repeat protein
MTPSAKCSAAVLALSLAVVAAKPIRTLPLNLATARAVRAVLALAAGSGASEQITWQSAAVRETLRNQRVGTWASTAYQAWIVHLATPPDVSVAAIEKLAGDAARVRPTVALWLGQAYLDQGYYQRALIIWTEIGAVQQLKALAEELEREGRLEDAVKAYTASLQGLREDIKVYLGLGRVLEQLGREDEALEVYRQALAALPRDYGVYLAVGEVYRGRRMFDEAQAWYNLAVRETGRTEWPYIASARAHEDQGALDQAVERLTWVIEHYPQNCQAWGRLGIVLWKQGIRDRAISALEEGTRLCPDTGWLVEALAQIRGATEGPEKSEGTGPAAPVPADED